MKKIKNTFLIAMLLTVSALTATVTAQMTIGATTPPQPFSALELISGGGKGLRLPQLTYAQRDALQATAEFQAEITGKAMGLQIFNTSNCCVETWNGAVWIRVGDSCKGQTTVTDIEGHVYKIVPFGCTAGCWMTENLATTTYPDGTAIPQKTNTNTNNEPSYWIPNKSIIYGSTLTATEISNAYTNRVGFLYTWAAAAYPRATDAGADTENDPNQTVYQGVCPQGWHLPSDYEWNQLEKEIATNYSQYSDMTVAPAAWNTAWETITGERPASTSSGHEQAMKSKNPPVGGVYTPRGLSKASDFGFNSLLVGFAYGGDADMYGSTTYYWNSCSNSSTDAWLRALDAGGSTGVYRLSASKSRLLSVRCKKNDN